MLEVEHLTKGNVGQKYWSIQYDSED